MGEIYKRRQLLFEILFISTFCNVLRLVWAEVKYLGNNFCNNKVEMSENNPEFFKTFGSLEY